MAPAQRFAAAALAASASVVVVVEASKGFDYFGTKNLGGAAEEKLESCMKDWEEKGQMSSFALQYKSLADGNNKVKLPLDDVICKINDVDVVGFDGDGCRLTYTIEGPRKKVVIPPSGSFPGLYEPESWYAVRCCRTGQENKCYVGNVVDYSPNVAEDAPFPYTAICAADTLDPESYPGAEGGPWDAACSELQVCEGTAPGGSYEECVAPKTCQDVTAVQDDDNMYACPLKKFYSCRWSDGNDEAGYCDGSQDCTAESWPQNVPNDTACDPGMTCDTECAPTL